jgi:hypothetical protein
VLWRLARTYYNKAKAATTTSATQHAQYVHAGHAYAMRAVHSDHIDDDDTANAGSISSGGSDGSAGSPRTTGTTPQKNSTSADAHKWAAILLSEVGELSSTQVRIENAHKFRAHTQRALTLAPHDASLHHMMGRFCFELANISWVVRRLAAATVGSLPDTSFEEAHSHFVASQRLLPDWHLNQRWLGRVLVALGRRADAERAWRHGVEVAAVTREDEVAQAECRAALGL